MGAMETNVIGRLATQGIAAPFRPQKSTSRVRLAIPLTAFPLLYI